ncbi:Bardet-Biedl syndrome 4 protein homolog [Danaus plexippus]|uniref:Bardet-Biedl syndrome 4 protein homolog n=1 Tax=Danaus plexippus TaxID=13037 RepID=UPI002AB1F639|nr:Bardet-Biedl syndrome 4 protein homolog [Danaus plexippus]
MRKQSSVETLSTNDFKNNSFNWLLYARYVRGENTLCLELVDRLQQDADNKHRYAHYIKGAMLADAGRLQEAVEKYHSCIRLQPRDPDPLKQVAKCLYKQGRTQLALEAYLEAEKISKHPDPDVYCGLASCAASISDPRDVSWARAALSAGGGERAASLLAARLLARGDTKDALAVYEHAVSEYSCGADTLSAAGALCLRTGLPRRAFQLLGEALSQQPTQHAAALALAAMLLQHRDEDAALARLKAALTAHPDCVAAHSDLGLALFSKKKFIAALWCCLRASWAAPLSAAAAHNAGLVLLASRRPASAFCRLASAAALNPRDAYTVLLIALSLERVGDGRADAAFDRACELAPHDALVRINCGGRHARVGRLEHAAREAGVVARLLEDQPDAHLASSLATLMALLTEAGITIQVTEPDETYTAREELASDEV